MHNDLHEEEEVAADGAPSAAEGVVEGAAKVPREYPPFASNVQGRRIRHARTGAYYNELVGSRGEHLYFKVCDARPDVKTGRREAMTYFYDSPADYESVGGTVSDKVRIAWQERRNTLAPLSAR